MPEKKRRKPRHAGRTHEFTNHEQEAMCFYFIAAKELGLPLGIGRMLTNLHGTVFQLSSDVDVRKFATIGFKKIKDLYVAFLIYTDWHCMRTTVSFLSLSRSSARTKPRTS